VPLRPGLVIAIEPWFLAGGSDDYRVDADGWTLRSADGSRAAHVEHTVAVTADGPRILTARASAQRLVEVGEQVLDVLDADRQPHQVTGHLQR
jgi:Xaa-Pro aminopeptidase